jgi:hypothetical protein
MTLWPNHARGCVKTPRAAFWGAKKWSESPSPKIKMRHNENVSTAFSANRLIDEFSHRLALQTTRDGAFLLRQGYGGRSSSARDSRLLAPACLSSRR